MGYVTENLMPGEHVVHRTHFHWIIFFGAIVMTSLGLSIFTGGAELVGLAAFFLLMGVVSAIGHAIELQVSEFAVTDRRILAKTGLLRRTSLDLNLAKVESVQVEQDIVGRLLDYGTLVVTGTGGTREKFKYIADPLAFRMHVQEQAEHHGVDQQQITALEQPTKRGQERECPYCAETILAKARICKHCSREVEPVDGVYC